ncbi:MAG: tetratricopeptide repeat protein [Proteobacteria bacterium]|nr:tetratricopeptide repeat protein [Pseudomonadota bacterium]
MKAQQLFESAVEAQIKGQLPKAKAAYQKLIRSYPSNSEVLGNLASIIKREGQLAAAETLLERSLRANPLNIAAMATLANLRIQQKRFDDAWEICEKAEAINPNYPENIINMGVVYGHRSQLKKAESAFRRALQIDSGNVNAKMNLANVFRLQKIYVDESTKILEILSTQHPDNPEIWMCLCTAYQEKHLFVKAIEAARRAFELDQKPDYIAACANSLVVLGEGEEAMRLYRKTIEIDPNNMEIPTTLLFALNYDAQRTAAEVFNEYKSYGAKLKTEKIFDHSKREPIRDRRIRIAYSSGDFCAHVVMYFILPILMSHDRSKFEIYAYANVFKPDAQTASAQKFFDYWIDVVDMSDEEVAERMHADDIDIVIDLAGHTAGNRLKALAMRPAPIQATYLGYGYTTGMKEIDYFIGDELFTPEGCDEFFTEKIIRVAAPVYGYEPPVQFTPDVAELPARRNGYITFGSMSRIIRFNDSLLKVWKEILDRVPNSRLRLDQKPFGDPETCDRVLARLEKLGFDRNQVDLVSTTPHWAGYHEFDISLDCWPHNAGTTTFESLWMGVPVLSKKDRPSVGRHGIMVLGPMGLSDWVVDTEAEFVQRAVEKASDIEALAALRASLRDRVKESPFLDRKARTRGLEAGYIEMVRRYNEERA